MFRVLCFAAAMSAYRALIGRLVGVYVLFTEDEAPNPDHARLKLIADGDRFQLYKILNPETAASK